MTFKAPELKDIRPEEWQFYGLWKQDIFSACFWQICFWPEVLARFGFDIDFSSTLIGNGGHFFYHKPTIEEIGKIISQKILSGDMQSFRDFRDEARSVYLSGVEFARKTSTDAPISPEYFREFINHGGTMSLYWWFAAVHLAITVEGNLRDKVVEHDISETDVPNLLPKVETPIIEQQKELTTLKQKIKGLDIETIRANPALYSEIEAHRKKYAWIETANWIGEEITFEKIINQIEHAHDSVQTEVKMNVPKELESVLEAMGCTAFVKQGGAEYVAMYEYLMMPYLKKLAAHLGLTYREMMKVSQEEIMAVLSGGVNNLKGLSEKKNRLDMRWILVSVVINKAVLVEDEEDIITFEKVMVSGGESETGEIKGQIGNKGKYTGPVKVIMNVDDFHKMESGDVLVTTMTTPEFVMLMQKAGAIVTDIGGMLCHAAIVSREINRPCIIGVKIATKVLKDGDKVEVDANNGIVKILDK
jgi:phosphohistidine swiveling domain-containing protein